MNATPIPLSAKRGHTGMPLTVSSVVPGPRNCVCVWCQTSARWAPRSDSSSSGISRMCITNRRGRSSGEGNSPPNSRKASQVPTTGIESTAE